MNGDPRKELSSFTPGCTRGPQEWKFLPRPSSASTVPFKAPFCPVIATRVIEIIHWSLPLAPRTESVLSDGEITSLLSPRTG